MKAQRNKRVSRKKTTYSGATRSAATSGSAIRRYTSGLLRGSIFLLSGAILVVVCYLAMIFFERASERPINSVNIAGDFRFISKEKIAQSIAPLMNNGFLLVPLDEIKTTLETNPWIDQAAVARRWPDQLSISIVEQAPIARWGKQGFLNHKGEIVTTPELQQLENLPLLSGTPEQAKLLMQNYQQLSQLLRSSGLVIRELYCDSLLSWKVILGHTATAKDYEQQRLVIALGRDQVMDKIQRFLVVYAESLSKKIDDVEAIDLRYGNGVAVRWKPSDRNNAAGSQVQLATLGERTR